MSVVSCQNYIGGEWVSAENEKTFEQRNPARLSEVTGRFALSSATDVRRAIAAAEEAFPKWRSTSPARRAEILRRAWRLLIDRRESIAKVVTAENGKTMAESLAEVDSAAQEMEYQIAEGLRMFGETAPSRQSGVFAYSMREPLGVAGIISPWNFPFNVPVRKCVPALISGNTCVFKPASLTPQTGVRFVELFCDAGLPAGVLNLVTGPGGEAGDTLISDPRVKAISFTGSTNVGMAIHQKAAATLTRTQLEMGGKNAAVILEDADLDLAADATVLAAFACAGQWCTSTSRAIVSKNIAEEFAARVVDRAASICVGDGTDPATGMGPVCGRAQLDGILKYIEKGREEGAILLTGGGRVSGAAWDDGCFIRPTVFGNVTPDMAIAREEIFGPVLVLLTVADLDEAIRVADAVPFGLASSIFTNDLSKAMAFVERTDVGLTHVNMMSAYKEPQLAFGGRKESGFGLPEAGKTGIEFFTQHKVVYVKYR
ncbi:MAG: aldehyde dehydrogenase family protein [Candidatus Hydrogenedentes bacterium]|nr:aldehyde dehydrogenase family protein [Candidatus Hydrogenedentota bacterium]